MAVELTVECEREQFGKKIGTYQAVSHPVVDAYVAVELARRSLLGGVVHHDGRRAGRPRVRGGERAGDRGGRRACETSIQVHGGIGFTFEHPLHRYYKRALRLESALGYGREQRAEIAASLLSS